MTSTVQAHEFQQAGQGCSAWAFAAACHYARVHICTGYVHACEVLKDAPMLDLKQACTYAATDIPLWGLWLYARVGQAAEERISNVVFPRRVALVHVNA